VAGANKFDPKDAIILQNKDEVLIPLLTTVLPSAKEFKDAIQSLSPEQQEFAKAFRGMQLESSVFGVCIVQIKPQLEKLLGLPSGALTKEIQLTQDLMSLFVDYQVPSDLLTFEGAAESTQAEKVHAVKGHVKSVMDMIAESKTRQLKEEAMKADMRTEMMHLPPGQQQPQPFQTAMFAGFGSVGPLMQNDVERHSTDMGTVASEDGMAPVGDISERSGGGRIRTRRLVGAKRDSPRFNKMGVGSMASMSHVEVPPSEVPAAPLALQSPSEKTRPQPKTKSPAPRSELNQSAESIKPIQQQLSHDVTQGLSSATGEDFTLIPKVLDAMLEKHDKDNALRSTIIKAGSGWTRTRQENFLTGPTSMSLATGDIAAEKKKSFDLLDAISRSGTLAIDCAELHVFIAISHCFDNDVMGTVVQDNINPIAKVERSALMLASTIHGQAVERLIAIEQDRQRLQSSFPLLFESSDSDGLDTIEQSWRHAD
jgi:hypothetical protein